VVKLAFVVYMVKMVKTVFYADLLGFASLSAAPGAAPAVDALSDLATIFSQASDLAHFLQASAWTRRYGLSDSIFLVADDPAQACAAAAEIFFNLAFYRSPNGDGPLLRGAIAHGEVQEVGPLFPETASFNVVGEAVVRAVRLEQSGAKGPRLLLAPEVRDALYAGPADGPRWMADTDGGVDELLWILPPEPREFDALAIADVIRAAANLLTRMAADVSAASAVAHALAYVDLTARALLRLRERSPAVGADTIAYARVTRRRARGRVLLMEPYAPADAHEHARDGRERALPRGRGGHATARRRR
jgi:hypothetical protein